MNLFLCIAIPVSLFTAIPGGFMALMATMLFDAPGSQNNPFTWAMHASIVLYPLFAILCPMLSWLAHASGEKKRANLIMIGPLVPVATTIIADFFNDVICDGKFDCPMFMP